LKKAIESNDAAAISREMEALTQAQHKAAANLYQQTAPGGSAPGGEGGTGGAGGTSSGGATGGATGGSGDVIDAEVVD
jgi:hypothetical protein